MKKPELLAPAGNMESLKAAIEAGCDAVYLGGYMFGARAFASNFSNEEIKEAVIYAHLYGVKIYITVNTLIYEDEVEIFMNYIDFLYKANVDAVIIEDIGMLDLIRQTYPLLEVHASTQMHIHNLEGVKFAQSLGVKRVVLARETDIDLVKKIKQSTNIELEIFVHGALCISYSGQCLMSSLIGGRSGNRGACAGSCRQKYDLLVDENGLKKVNKEEYLLSTKDLNTLEYLGELIEIGVDSLKIEGRMKRPEYVYLIVNIYRKAIDNYCKCKKIEITKEDILELKKIFNRGFTKGFLFHEENNNYMNQKRPNHMGIPIGKVLDYKNGKIILDLYSSLQNGDGIRILGKNDSGTIITKIIQNKRQEKKVYKGIVEIPYKVEHKKGDLVLKTTDKEQLDRIENKLNHKSRKVLISMFLELKVDKNPILKISDGKNEVVVTSSYIVQKANNIPITKERIKEQLQKVGDTVYKVENIIFDIEENIFMSIQKLNELRREGILKLNEKRCYNYPYKREIYQRTVPNFLVQKMKTALISKDYQYPIIKNENFDSIYVEKEDLFEKLKQDQRILYKIPRVIHHISKKIEPQVTSELGSFYTFPHTITDFSFNIVNSYSTALLFSLGAKKVTLSYEMDERQIKLLVDAYKNRYHAHPNLEVIVYGNEEVMISKFHLLQYFDRKENYGYLKDRFSNLYFIEENPNFMKIYNYKPRNNTNIDYYHLGINSLRYQFFNETEEEIKRVIRNEV